MSRIDNRFVRKGPQLFPDAKQQCSVIAAREVSPPDAFVKQYVTADQKRPLGIIEPDASGRVSGQEKDLETVPVQFDGPARNQKMLEPPIILERHPPLQAHGRRHGQNGLLFFVEMKR